MEQRQVDQRPEGVSADYEYDEAHDRPDGELPVRSRPPRPARAPAGRWEADGDMGYDEAHSF